MHRYIVLSVIVVTGATSTFRNKACKTGSEISCAFYLINLNCILLKDVAHLFKSYIFMTVFYGYHISTFALFKEIHVYSFYIHATIKL